MLCDRDNKCHVVYYVCKKSKSLVRYKITNEVNSFMNSFDMDCVIRRDLTMFLDMSIYIGMMTDSKQLFDAVTCCKRTTERRLTIDLTTARQSYWSD